MKKYLKDLVPLIAICLVAALLLAVFNMITEGPIAENTIRAAAETRTRLLPAAASFEAVELDEGSAMDSCYEGLDANGESVGYVVETTVGGYGGEIVVTVGMNADNIITGINVGGENFSETAGLGAKAKEASFTDQFIGESVPLSLQKGTSGTEDGVIDAIAGATITSTAVNGGVNAAGKFVMDLSGGGASPNTASVQGFAGPVSVTLSLDEAGAITEITIGDAFFNETEGYGRKALEEGFQAQFIGKVPPLTLGDIDAIAGATITSNAVVNAINQVQAQLSGAAPVATPAEEPDPVAPASENAKTASAQGFAGPVAVAVDLDENNTITAITIGDDKFAETAGFGAKAQEDTFKAQFIGKTLPIAFEDIDAIAGATITSKAVVEALNAIVAPAGEEAVEAAAPAAPAASENAKTASAQGFAGPVAVAVDLDENNTITAITIGDDKFAETAGFGAKAQEDGFKAQFIGKTLPIAFEDIDAIAGATITSKAVVEALNAIVAPAGEEAVEAAAPAAPAASENAKTASAQGFAGPVAVAVDLDENNTITAITIGDDKFAETAGFGAKAQEDAFKAQFIGKTLPIAFEDIDAIAGATITSKAVVEALNAIVAPAGEEAVEAAAPAAPAASENAKTASAQGFAGPVAVAVDLDENNTITAITIGDDKFAETAGFGAKAQEDAFKAQFIGKTLPIAFEDIDAIAGATITSKAVVEALNAIVAPAGEEVVETIASATPAANETTAAEEETISNAKQLANPVAVVKPETPEVEESPSNAKPLANPVPVKKAVSAGESTVLTGSAQGFAGPVAVEVTVENNVITALTVGDAKFAETPGLGAKAQEEAFTAQFIGKSLPVDAATIDVIAGATITTNAVIEAVNTVK